MLPGALGSHHGPSWGRSLAAGPCGRAGPQAGTGQSARTPGRHRSGQSAALASPLGAPGKGGVMPTVGGEACCTPSPGANTKRPKTPPSHPAKPSPSPEGQVPFVGLIAVEDTGPGGRLTGLLGGDRLLQHGEGSGELGGFPAAAKAGRAPREAPCPGRRRAAEWPDAARSVTRAAPVCGPRTPHAAAPAWPLVGQRKRRRP